MQDFYYFDHAYLFGNKHDKSKEIGEKIYRLTKNYFHIRDIKEIKKKITNEYKNIENI